MRILNQIFSDVPMVVLIAVTLLGLVLIWFTWSFTFGVPNFFISLLCSLFMIWQTWKYGKTEGLYK